MKQYLLLIFSFLISNILISQEVKNYDFLGTLQLSDKTIITFKLSFKEETDGIIKGTSLSDIYGADRTLSKIEGKISKDKKTISFKEIANLNTKSQADVGTFCFIEINNAKLRTVKDKTIMQGAFVGKFKSGKRCAEGYIYMMSSDYVNKLADELLPSKNIKNQDSLNSLRKKVNELKNQTNNNIIKSNETLSLAWSSQEIIIDLWDGQTEDKDEISIEINGEKVLDKFIITNQKKTLILPVKEQLSSIKISAVSEGNTSPCTANIKLRDGKNETSLVAVLKKGESTTIKLIDK